MGDLCSSLKAYSRALDFYLKILNVSTKSLQNYRSFLEFHKMQKAQEQNWAPKKMNPIFVSISQTYMDLKDYKSAIVFYKKELEQYGENPSEVSTLTKSFK